jgi:DNA-binding MarR family transcriptional regulator
MTYAAPVGEPAKTRNGPGGSPTVEDVAPLATALRIALLRIARRLRAERDESLTLSQLSALSSLERVGQCSPSALAELEQVQPPSMTRVIAALEEHGYAARAPHAHDRRQAVIAITPAGSAVLAQTRQRATAWLAQALDAMTPDERALLAGALPLLQRLLEH